MKPKKESVTKLKQKADVLFSRWLRLYHSDASGYTSCYTCGKVAHWKELQCGHLFSRARLATRYDPDNCRPQCYGCNCAQKGNYQEYFPRIIEEMGHQAIKDLEAKSKAMVKTNAAFYRQVIDETTEKLKEYKDGRD